MTTALQVTRPFTEQPWYRALIEECQGIIEECQAAVTEHRFQAYWAVIEGWHKIGKRILEENENFERCQIYGEKILQSVAKSLGKGERSLYYAVKAAKSWPDLDQAPIGKNTTWTKLIRERLTEKGKEIRDEVEENYPHFRRCPNCGLWRTDPSKYLCKCGE